MAQKVPTIRDVAREANVSVATVSHVFNNTRRVTQATRSQVLYAAERLNYVPSGIARSLSTHRTNMIGMVVSDATSPYNTMIIHGMENRLWQHGLSLLVCATDESVEKESQYLKLLLERRVDGIVVAPTGKPQPIFDEIRQRHISLLFVDRRPAEPFGPVVEIDNVRAGYLATEYLIGLGHRKIAMITRDFTLSTVVGRTQGYLQALRSYGITPDTGLICQIEANVQAADQATGRLLSAPNPPTALIAANHVITLGVLAGLQRRNILCPDAISLVGFDDHPWVSVLTPQLTVINHPFDAICDAIVATLLRMNADHYREDDLETKTPDASAPSYPDTVLPPELIIRKSCKRLN